MYSAEIIGISEVDQSGSFEVYFNVFLDKEILFEKQSRRGIEKDVVVEEIKTYLKEIQQQHNEVKKFEIGEVISI